MRASKMLDHDGWDLVTTCREDNPENWKPGDPIRFAARGFAEFARPHHFAGTWSDKKRQNHPLSGELHFDDFNEAHNAIEAKLREMVDILKVK
jgi:hypothetical protein